MTGEVAAFTAPSSQGYRLAGQVSGSGEAVLLALHGGPGGGGASYLAGLHDLAGPTRRVVTFDQLGTGGSDVPSVPYEWTVENAAADVDAVRMHVGVEHVDVLGHSWGGMLALQYAVDFPVRVRRLILSNTCSSTARMITAMVRQVLRVLPPDDAVAALTADATGDHADPRFAQGMSAWLSAFMTNGDEESAQELSAEAEDPGPAGLGLWGPHLWLATGALRGWTVDDRLHAVTAPTLAVHGGHDSSDRDINQVFADRIPDCEWITLNNCGHDMLTGRHTDTYLRLIDGFLNRTAQGADS